MGSSDSTPAFQKQVPEKEIAKLVEDYFKNYDMNNNQTISIDEAMQYHQKKLGSHSETHAAALRESCTEEFDKWKPGHNGTITRDDLRKYWEAYFDKNPGSITI